MRERDTPEHVNAGSETRSLHKRYDAGEGPQKAYKIIMLLAVAATAATILLIAWAMTPPPGTRMWHEETLARTAKAFEKCRRFFPRQEFYDCVKDRAGRWIRLNRYAAINGVPAFDEQLSDFRRAEAQAKAKRSGDLGDKANEQCHSTHGLEQSISFMNCVADQMYPESQAAKDESRILTRGP